MNSTLTNVYDTLTTHRLTSPLNLPARWDDLVPKDHAFIEKFRPYSFLSDPTFWIVLGICVVLLGLLLWAYRGAMLQVREEAFDQRDEGPVIATALDLGFPSKCESCGAPLQTHKCNHCGTINRLRKSNSTVPIEELTERQRRLRLIMNER